jgi:hypothetical protein
VFCVADCAAALGKSRPDDGDVAVYRLVGEKGLTIGAGLRLGGLMIFLAVSDTTDDRRRW